MKVSQAKKEKGVFCCAYGCGNTPYSKLGGLCPKHYRRKRKKIDPVGLRYNNFKKNAIRRGKDFTITLEQFRVFCKNTGYIIKKGMRGMNATIDRIDNNRGYHIDNIHLLTHKANCSKGTESWKPEEIEQPWLNDHEESFQF